MGETEEKDFKVVTIPNELSFWAKVKQELFIMVVIHYFWWFFGGIFITYVAYCFNYHYYLIPFVLVYLPSFFDNSHLHLGRPWPWLRRHPLWRLSHQYAGVEVIRTKKLDPKKNYIFAYHPHGILILNRILAYGGLWEELFPSIDFRVLGATPMFWVPGAREICLWMGAVDASKRSAERVLEAGISLMIYPGGSKEIFLTNPHSKETKIVLKDRKGFVKIAIRYGCPLVPVVVYGEKHCYDKYEVSPKVKKWFLQTLKIPLIVFWGKYFTWTPKRKPLSAVFGEPIEVIKTEHPTEAYIDSIHEQYTEALKKLFDEYKTRYPFAKDEVLVVS